MAAPLAPCTRASRLTGWWLVVSMLGTILAPALASTSAAAASGERTVVLCTARGLVSVTIPGAGDAGELPASAVGQGCGSWCTACVGGDGDAFPAARHAPPTVAGGAVRQRGSVRDGDVRRFEQGTPPPSRAPPTVGA